MVILPVSLRFDITRATPRTARGYRYRSVLRLCSNSLRCLLFSASTCTSAGHDAYARRFVGTRTKNCAKRELNAPETFTLPHHLCCAGTSLATAACRITYHIQHVWIWFKTGRDAPNFMR